MPALRPSRLQRAGPSRGPVEGERKRDRACDLHQAVRSHVQEILHSGLQGRSEERAFGLKSAPCDPVFSALNTARIRGKETRALCKVEDLSNVLVRQQDRSTNMLQQNPLLFIVQFGRSTAGCCGMSWSVSCAREHLASRVKHVSSNRRTVTRAEAVAQVVARSKH